MVLFQYDAVTDPVTGHMVRWSVGAFLSPRAGKITTFYSHMTGTPCKFDL